MASGLASFLRDAEFSEFSPQPYYDKGTDRLRVYVENRRAYSQFVNRFLTLFLAIDTEEVVGFQIDNVSIVIRAIEGMNKPVPLCGPITTPSGNEVEVAMLFRQAAVSSEIAPNRYAAVNEKTRGIRIQEPCS